MFEHYVFLFSTDSAFVNIEKSLVLVGRLILDLLYFFICRIFFEVSQRCFPYECGSSAIRKKPATTYVCAGKKETTQINIERNQGELRQVCDDVPQSILTLAIITFWTVET
jgi:hypothetical protein